MASATAPSATVSAAAAALLPVVLYRGSGTRWWPLSREHYPVKNVEVQSGAHLGEDDIIRFDDRQGRVSG